MAAGADAGADAGGADAAEAEIEHEWSSGYIVVASFHLTIVVEAAAVEAEAGVRAEVVEVYVYAELTKVQAGHDHELYNVPESCTLHAVADKGNYWKADDTLPEVNSAEELNEYSWLALLARNLSEGEDCYTGSLYTEMLEPPAEADGTDNDCQLPSLTWTRKVLGRNINQYIDRKNRNYKPRLLLESFNILAKSIHRNPLQTPSRNASILYVVSWRPRS